MRGIVVVLNTDRVGAAECGELPVFEGIAYEYGALSAEVGGWCAYERCGWAGEGGIGYFVVLHCQRRCLGIGWKRANSSAFPKCSAILQTSLCNLCRASVFGALQGLLI